MRQEGKHDEKVGRDMTRTVTLPDDIYERVVELARQQGQPVDVVVTAALVRGLSTSDERDQTVEGRKSRAVAMREMELTLEEAAELRERIEHPAAFPTRAPWELPAGDSSLLR